MEFDEYQTKAHHTANYKLSPHIKVAYDEGSNSEGKPIITISNTIPAYPFIKVMAESAELAEPAIKSALRGDETPISELQIEKEIGDLLWYCAEMATVCGMRLESIAKRNLDKLEDRAKRNQIKGSGDNR